MNRALRLAVASAIVLATSAVSTQEKKDEPGAKEGLILDRGDTIRFTTDEGTWMSIDVSPDGRTIVFDLLGDIYTLPIEGGSARRIAGGMSFESQPTFSPDGRTIAFLSDRSGVENLWLMDADGAHPRPVTKDKPTNDRPEYMLSPSWVPGGQYLLVSKSRPPETTFGVFLYDRDGGTGIRIGSAPPPQPAPGEDAGPPRPAPNRMGAVASPDGRFVYYAERTGTFTYNARFPLWQIVRFDRETGDTATVTNAQGSAMRPLLSPDGRFLVFATRYETETGLRVRDLETGDERWLIHPVTRDDQESRASRDTMPGYAFMPDGKSLVVPIGGKIQRVDFATGRATPIPFTAAVEADIAPRLLFENAVADGPTVRARLVRWPRFSPDGRRVAFSALAKVWIMDLPNGKPRRLTSLAENEFMPAWSPDGKYIAFVTWSKDGGQIYRVAPDGGQPERLSRYAAYYGEPVYTPDGTKIVFTTGRRADQLYADLRYIASGADRDVEPDATAPAEIAGIAENADMDLRWIPSGGGDSTLIGSTRHGGAPHFAGDSVHVYLTGSRGLSAIRIDGFDRRQVVQITGNGPGQNPPEASEIRMSPDGRRAFVSLQNKHVIVGVPRAGREVVKISVKGKGDDSAVPVKRLSREGGDYLSWTADGKAVAWSLGSTIYRQALDADKPEAFDVVVEAPRAKPDGSIVLAGARVVTMKAGAGEVIEKGDVVITGNRIAAVGPAGTVTRPAGAKVVDAAGKTIIPGFVDVHSHMWPPRGVHQSQVWQYLANLAYGVTTTRDPQTSTNDVFEYADLVETGAILGPRVLATGPGVFSSSGLDDKETTADFIKRYKDAYKTDTIKEYVAGDRIVRQWIILAAKDHRLMPTTEGSLDMKLDLSQMIDGYTGSEHSLPIQPLYKDVTEFVARSHTFYTPTTLVAYGAPWSENYYFESTPNLHADPKMRRFIPHELYDTMVRRRGQWFLPEEYGHKGIAKGIADVVHAGGRVGLGSHGQFQGLGAHWEIWDLQSGGLTPLETLRVATRFGAEALGLQKDVGSIEAGKLADVLVLDRNPLLDIHDTLSLKYVMKNGVLYDSATLDTVWPNPRKLERQYWWEDQP
ncbi:MAG TPA: amidohydrolase family protein [Vicinamibacterales bacterium]|nr:amidohydrolase family protein [Vicinamibacterales bacterium]